MKVKCERSFKSPEFTPPGAGPGTLLLACLSDTEGQWQVHLSWARAASVRKSRVVKEASFYTKGVYVF